MVNKPYPHPVHQLELRVHALAQLFNSMDPTPFHSKALDREAETFIEAWAAGFRADSRLHLVIHLLEMPVDGDPCALITEAVHHHFKDKATAVRRDLRELFRVGRTSMVIGLIFVSLCLLGADTIGQLGSGTAHTIARESLTIVGWVAMWRPLQIFLYDWWPMARRIGTYKALMRAHVRVLQGE